MKKGAALGVACAIGAALAFAAPAHAMTFGKHVDPCWLLAHQVVDPGAQTITVVNQANVKPENLCRVELAVQQQALQLRAAWGTPPISFGAGGWKVYVQPNTPVIANQISHIGGHWEACSGPYCGGSCVDAECAADTYTPYARVIRSFVCVTESCSRWQPWTVPFSHEIMEMLVDPQGSGPEVCDPVYREAYLLNGVKVARFVAPSYYG